MTSQQNVISQRLGWIDSAKGVGIVLVVIGHAWRGLETSGLIKNASLYNVVDTTIYSFHMPLFFFLSGLLIERSLLGSAPIEFAISRVRRLIWPLALWTWVFFLFKDIAGNLVNKGSDWADFPIFPLPPREHFWFLWALFVIHLATLAFRPALQTSEHRQRDWALFWLASVLFYLFGPALGVLSPWFYTAISYAPFFLLGAAMSGLRGLRLPVWLGLVTFAVFVAVVVSSLYVPNSSIVHLVIGSAATIFLCSTIMAFEAPFLSHRSVTWIGWLGTASLAIYVSHTIFSAATRIVLVKIGVTDLSVHMVVGTLAGLLLPAALYVAARRMGLSGVLGF